MDIDNQHNQSAATFFYTLSDCLDQDFYIKFLCDTNATRNLKFVLPFFLSTINVNNLTFSITLVTLVSNNRQFYFICKYYGRLRSCL